MTLVPLTRFTPRSHPSLIGTLGGALGGLAFGIIMYAVGMFPMIARLVRQDDLITGIMVHILISLVFGALYGVTLAWRTTRWQDTLMVAGLYGVFWWVLGANILMPLLLGAPITLSGFTSSMSLVSLGGHVLYGVLTGAISVAMSSLDD